MAGPPSSTLRAKSALAALYLHFEQHGFEKQLEMIIKSNNDDDDVCAAGVVTEAPFI